MVVAAYAILLKDGKRKPLDDVTGLMAIENSNYSVVNYDVEIHDTIHKFLANGLSNISDFIDLYETTGTVVFSKYKAHSDSDDENMLTATLSYKKFNGYSIDGLIIFHRETETSPILYTLLAYNFPEYIVEGKTVESKMNAQNIQQAISNEINARLMGYVNPVCIRRGYEKTSN